jgi:hypothetical protein
VKKRVDEEFADKLYGIGVAGAVFYTGCGGIL